MSIIGKAFRILLSILVFAVTFAVKAVIRAIENSGGDRSYDGKS